MDLLRHLDVLDKGFIRLIDFMGHDLKVVNAARVSFHKESQWADYTPDELGNGTYSLTDKDQRLIQYLAKHNHWTPFAHVVFTYHIKCPIFVARQWMRHNIGIVYNEVSRRYVDSEPEFYEPEVWRGRPEGGMKQGSSGELEDQAPLTLLNWQNWSCALSDYQRLLSLGVAPEQARMVLPQSTYTEFWMTASLPAVARIHGLRVDSHAQWEIQQYAKAMGELTKPIVPYSWEALTCREKDSHSSTATSSPTDKQPTGEPSVTEK